MSISRFQVQRWKVTLYKMHVLGKQLSRSLCFKFMHQVLKNILFLARCMPAASASLPFCKISPDGANSLRAVRYQMFSPFDLGANPWVKVYQKGRWPATHLHLPSCQFHRLASTHARDIAYKNLADKFTKKERVNDISPSMPIDMWR